jgi:hypothetical protein
MYSFSEREERVGERECVLETSSMVLRAGWAVEEGWREGVGRVMVRTLVIEGDFSFKEAILAVLCVWIVGEAGECVDMVMLLS